MKMRKQEAPFCLQIELAFGCNLACAFCGMQGAQEQAGKGLHFMSVNTADLVARRIKESGWNPRLEFARRGEPTMNPEYAECIARFHHHNPNLQIMMTSNGGGLLRPPGPLARLTWLFEAGLNILALDDYDSVKIVPKIRAVLAGMRNAFPIQIYEYPRDAAGNPHRRYTQRTQFISFLEDISRATAGVHSKLNNHAGHGAELDLSYDSPCSKPFRELGINYDGSIDLCCIDWISEYRLGSLQQNSLEQLWQCDAMNAARQYLLRGRRSKLRPCAGCNHPSYRVGLLPDKLGKATLPKPTATTAELVRLNMAKGPIERPTALAASRIWHTLPAWLQQRWTERRNAK